MSAQFLYSEKRLASALGISFDRSREIRDIHLQRDADWKKIRREILLTEGGLRTVVRVSMNTRFAAPPKLSDCLPQKNGAPNGAKKKMRIVAIPMNPRMVLATESGGVHHLVYVGRNATFAFGDEIEVEPYPNQDGVWQLVSAIPRDRRRPR